MSEQKKKLTKKTMTPDELRAYKKGKRVSNIRGFAIWLSANAAIAGAAYVGGKWAIKQYSPKPPGSLVLSGRNILTAPSPSGDKQNKN